MTAPIRPRPWADVDPRLVSPLAAVLRPTTEATISAIGSEVPSYRGLASGSLAATVGKGVAIALERLLDLIGRDDAALDERARRVYERIGAGEWRQGRSMEALLAAYRTGARVAWEQMSAAVVAAGASSTDIVALAEAIFVYIDELSAASAAGHAQAQSADAGRREALRARLAELVLAGSGEAEPARALADELGWVPGAAVVVAVAAVPAATRWPPATLPVGALVAESGERAVVVLPAAADPRGLSAPGAIVCLGPVRRLASAAESLRGAERLLGLCGEGLVVPAGAVQAAVLAGAAQAAVPPGAVPPGAVPTSVVPPGELAPGEAPPGALVRAEDHLTELVLTADPAAVADLRAAVLAPLADLPAGKRAALSQTLLAWLLSDGDRAQVAESLGVHPQTVTYRLGRLRELLGEELESPRARLGLVLALASQAENSTVTGA